MKFELTVGDAKGYLPQLQTGSAKKRSLEGIVRFAMKNISFKGVRRSHLLSAVVVGLSVVSFLSVWGVVEQSRQLALLRQTSLVSDPEQVPEETTEMPEHIEISPLILTVPLELEPILRQIIPRNPWHFPHWNISQAREFIESVKMPAVLRSSLIERLEKCPEVEGSMLMPDEADVLSLPADARAYIYNYLSFFDENDEQTGVRHYPAESLDEWFGNVEISESTWSLLEGLSYRNGPLLCIADHALLLSRIEDEQERFRVYKALHRVKTYRIQLRVAKDADLNQLANYWGAGLYDKDVIPILETLKENGDSIDIVHLLPPMPRQLVYHFPKTDSKRWKVQNCHWTSVNFFNPVASNRSLNEKSLWEMFENDYMVVQQEDLKFGDVVMYLVENAGEVRPVHSAVYIYDDLFFTKNGTNLFNPWRYIHLEDLDNIYTYGRPMVRKYYRRTPSSIERISYERKRKKLKREGNGRKPNATSMDQL